MEQEKLGLPGSKGRPCCGLQMGCPTRGKGGQTRTTRSHPSLSPFFPASSSLSQMQSQLLCSRGPLALQCLREKPQQRSLWGAGDSLTREMEAPVDLRS